LSTSDPTAEAFLEIGEKGFGFLRSAAKTYAPSPQDTFVSADLIRQKNLRPGLAIKGRTQPGSKGGPQLVQIETINGEPPEKYASVIPFDKLTTVHPLERIRLETGPDSISMRVLDLLAPVGKGQRGLIVSPPRSGKTTLLKQIANSVVKNHSEIYPIILLGGIRGARGHPGSHLLILNCACVSIRNLLAWPQHGPTHSWAWGGVRWEAIVAAVVAGFGERLEKEKALAATLKRVIGKI
jgi:hypothetical protein